MALTLGTGWLSKNLELPANNHGIIIPRWSVKEQAPFPTRTEEFWFIAAALEEAPRGRVLDAGTGFNPEIHLLPYILGNMGFPVTALDRNPETRHMPRHRQVHRLVGDMLALPHPDATFQYWVCVSTLEHLPMPAVERALVEMYRVLAPGGTALLTTDETDPALLAQWFQAFGMDSGAVQPLQGAPLTPRVSWAIATKP